MTARSPLELTGYRPALVLPTEQVTHVQCCACSAYHGFGPHIAEVLCLRSGAWVTCRPNPARGTEAPPLKASFLEMLLCKQGTRHTCQAAKKPAAIPRAGEEIL